VDLKMEKRKNITEITGSKDKKKLTCLTAYDCYLANLADQAGIDLLLVGDSLSMVFQGNQSTVPVTMDEMIYHTKIVVRSTHKALIVADMPFGSYQVSQEQAISNCIRMMKETGCQAVKMEGGQLIVPIVEHLTTIGVPVIGHLGLMPQSINKFGSYKLRAKNDKEAEELIRDAHALEKAGASAIVLEKIPAILAEEVSRSLKIPTIGIGAGSGCDGQVLVITDMLGLDENISFKFVRKYANLASTVKSAVVAYIQDVEISEFPADKESY
jgi:3-methyl-2-oxobutanoate hydroxymethyltransferase